LLFACALVCASAFLSLAALTSQFIFAPTKPVEASNNIVPWSNHGTYHYITPRQDLTKNWLLGVSYAAFMGMVLFAYLGQKR
jgi:hypothetical protein